jgi:hypothetical protein
MRNGELALPEEMGLFAAFCRVRIWSVNRTEKDRFWLAGLS